ncbi:hypothetical protein PIB30_094745 [Stylosanthes scabra]|uniref:Uncharacterized protein n=1 Tax=Stylosanthes scabra TaxID=79078 RepID=A0ABU6ZUX5_9FABA|nr:hypothetical protein [Stylosanthes scabra]
MIIGGFLFPDASDSRVHLRWLPLLADLDVCGRLSWVLPCWHTCTSRCIVGWITSRETWADAQFAVVVGISSWRGLHMARDSLVPRVRMWRMILYDIGHRGVRVILTLVKQVSSQVFKSPRLGLEAHA